MKTSEIVLTCPADAGILCDLCGGVNFTKRYEWPVGDFWNPASIPIAVFQCNDCGLVFLYPVPIPEQLPGAGDWWKQRSGFRRMRWWKKFWEPLRFVLVGTSKSRLVKATSRICPGGHLLDVGCGTGELLEEAQKYYNCHGLEPSPVAAQVSRQKGFSIVESTLEVAAFPASFDVVTMDSVIEHVKSPTVALSKVHSFLKPGGVLVLLTPKFGGPASTIHGRGWNGFRHGYHTFLYSGKTLSALLEKTGFDVMQSPKRDRPMDDILILWARKRED
jgi:2-polyprenyl-3-methyl-5-hydroxy-6-metoxy-1,4-benzoquinol methylase